jgi:serine phosphatase RsbU (regulator of sigma subunit)/uncharacterized membrane protein
MGNTTPTEISSGRTGRNVILLLFLLAAIGALLYAYLQYSTVEEFQVPIAYTGARDRIYVLEKADNTILELAYISPDQPLELLGRYKIEGDEPGHYYMVRKLYPGPRGVVVHSYIYEKETEIFLGYRFREYRSFDEPPREIFTIYLDNPEDVPEINYSRGPEGSHYFVNNCSGQYNIWKIAPDSSVLMEEGTVPPGIEELGEENKDFSSWEGIAVDPSGDIFLSSGSIGKLVKYSPAGKKQFEFGTPGKAEGEILAPSELFYITLTHDHPRSITVASTGNRSWVQFSSRGEPILTIDPLREGYEKYFRDILVGPIFALKASDQIFSFDLVNRSCIILSRNFAVITTFRENHAVRSAIFLGIALLLLAGAILARRLARWASRMRFPFFLKLLLFFVPILVVSASVVGYEVKKIMKEDLEDEYIRRSANLAAAILNSIKVSDLEQLRKSESRESPLYQNVHDAVSRIVNRKEVEYTPKWIIHLIDPEGKYFFGVNIWRGSIYEPFIVPDERDIFLKVLKDKSPQSGRFIDEQGEWFSYLTPVLNAEGKVINVLELYRPTEELDRADRRAAARIRERVGETVLIAIVLVLVFSYIFTRPLRKLIQGIKVVSTGDFDHKIIIRSRDEISRLAGAFNQMVVDLKKFTRDLARTTAEKERIETEMHVAHDVQQGLLPTVFPPYPEAPSLEIYARMEPAREVGGDYYDFFMVDREHVGVVVADVSGKGMPAGLFMMQVRTLLRSNALNNLSAADVLARTNRIIAADNPSVHFVTVFYLIFNLETGKAVYCNAGHNPPILIRKSEIGLLSTEEGAGKGVAVGVLDDAEYSDAVMSFDRDDSLVIYTDGATEAFNLEQKMFGEERLIQCVRDNSSLPSQEIWDRVFRAVSEFQAGREQFDDITILFLKFLGGAE